MKNSDSPPPACLSDEAGRWWKTITEDWLLEPHSKIILTSALESFDRMNQAKAIVDKEGLVVADRFGQPRPHPAALLERDARAAMERALKSLNLDMEPIGVIGRPGGT